MFAAMLGAIRATDRPTACHTESVRRRPGPGAAAWSAGAPVAPGRDGETAMSASWRRGRLRRSDGRSVLRHTGRREERAEDAWTSRSGAGGGGGGETPLPGVGGGGAWGLA